MPPCLEDLHGYTVVVVKGGQNRYFHSLYLRKQAKMPFSNCSQDRGRETRQFFRARFYRSTKFRLSLILSLRESCWGVPSPNPAMRLTPLKNLSKYFFGFFKNSSASHPVFLLLVRGHHAQKGGFYHAKTI